MGHGSGPSTIKVSKRSDGLWATVLNKKLQGEREFAQMCIKAALAKGEADLNVRIEALRSRQDGLLSELQQSLSSEGSAAGALRRSIDECRTYYAGSTTTRALETLARRSDALEKILCRHGADVDKEAAEWAARVDELVSKAG